MKNKKKNIGTPLIKAVALHSNSAIRWRWVIITVFSAAVALANVFIPIIERNILTHIASEDVNYPTELLFLVTFVSFALLILTNLLNIRVFFLFRQEFEKELARSLEYRTPASLKERGPGFYASSLNGDSDQIASVVGANWAALLFNFLASIASIIISARWSLTFFVIAMVAYALILLLIFIMDLYSVKNFRKAREEAYSVSPKVLEMVENRDIIMSYSDFNACHDELNKAYKKRDIYERKSRYADEFINTVIIMIESLCSVIFIFFAASEIHSGTMDTPTLVALLSYFETIFVPVSTINKTTSNYLKFQAFYPRIRQVLDLDKPGQIPENSLLDFNKVTFKDNNELILRDFTFSVDKIYGFIGLTPEGEKAINDLIEGNVIPEGGNITLGEKDVKDIRTNMLLAAYHYLPPEPQVFSQGLEYSITLGKELLSDEEYDKKKQEYLVMLSLFFKDLKEGTLFRKDHLYQTYLVLNDTLGILPEDLSSEKEKKEAEFAFTRILDKEQFISEIGPVLFARKYARKTRYESLVKDLDLDNLHDADFISRGINMNESEKKLVSIARFLLPEDEKNTFVLKDPLVHLNPIIANRTLKVIRKYLSGEKGIVLSSNPNTIRLLSDEIIVFENGEIKERGTHASLIRNSKRYIRINEEFQKNSINIPEDD